MNKFHYLLFLFLSAGMLYAQATGETPTQNSEQPPQESGFKITPLIDGFKLITTFGTDLDTGVGGLKTNAEVNVYLSITGQNGTEGPIWGEVAIEDLGFYYEGRQLGSAPGNQLSEGTSSNIVIKHDITATLHLYDAYIKLASVGFDTDAVGSDSTASFPVFTVLPINTLGSQANGQYYGPFSGTFINGRDRLDRSLNDLETGSLAVGYEIKDLLHVESSLSALNHWDRNLGVDGETGSSNDGVSPEALTNGWAGQTLINLKMIPNLSINIGSTYGFGSDKNFNFLSAADPTVTVFNQAYFPNAINPTLDAVTLSLGLVHSTPMGTAARLDIGGGATYLMDEVNPSSGLLSQLGGLVVGDGASAHSGAAASLADLAAGKKGSLQALSVGLGGRYIFAHGVPEIEDPFVIGGGDASGIADGGVFADNDRSVGFGLDVFYTMPIATPDFSDNSDNNDLYKEVMNKTYTSMGGALSFFEDARYGIIPNLGIGLAVEINARTFIRPDKFDFAGNDIKDSFVLLPSTAVSGQVEYYIPLGANEFAVLPFFGAAWSAGTGNKDYRNWVTFGGQEGYTGKLFVKTGFKLENIAPNFDLVLRWDSNNLILKDANDKSVDGLGQFTTGIGFSI